MSRRTRARTILFGLSPQCDVRATDVTSRGLDGFSFHLHYAGGTITVECPLPGKHHVYPALATAAVALNDGLTLADVATALRDAVLDMRLTLRRGPNNSTVIDDSYNASPASMVAALDLLAECSGRRIAVLGHMRELGAAEEEGHMQVGAHAASRCDILITVGEEARPIALAARQAGHTDVREVESPEGAEAVLNDELREGDVCLVKASRAVGLEQLVTALVAR
jgi:UDP-N-acetylmuramoyl-tripeptide--D-alanyl-D-alanine ligase